ncbi:hypothetical protein FIU88_08270 [Halomonas sp. THAF12]|uniref:DnaT-like ssDNA-binding protein n=1 Tax=Halomonas sp. THAF12 TaxID=2587849 RepID=UPI00126847E9|nr:DnaT-like ssDNA-binding protein [Halomonas sp. THAF12]QFT84969.1 hypothetical protein FIU88_08270 [Halomonas sp. THAF12]
MATYVTVSDVDTKLGTGWEGEGDKARAVLEANTWLTAKRVRPSDPVDDDVVMAGALLAQEAAAGRLYADTDGAVKSERVKADTVEVETEFQDGAQAQTGALSMIADLIAPYLPKTNGVTILRRL